MSIIKIIQKNKVFKFLSSVKLAVIVILSLGSLSAIGTIIESQYDAKLAKLWVYNSSWFLFVLAFLWINIFCAALSRYPFKKHQIGFVVTHTGMLTLIIGSVMTMFYGIDGSLRVVEKTKNSIVYLFDQNVINVQGKSLNTEINLSRAQSFKESSDFNSENDKLLPFFKIVKYFPFAEYTTVANQNAEGGGLSLGFLLRSPMFNVGETLHSIDRPEMEMGPAVLRLVVGKIAKTKKTIRKKSKSLVKASRLLVYNKKNELIKTIKLNKDSGKYKFKDIRVNVKNIFKSASVIDNKIAEGGGNANPAVEFIVSKGKDKYREVSYEKFPDFRLKPEGPYGYVFSFESGGGGDEVGSSNPRKFDRTKNTIEFHIDKNNLKVAVLKLFKKNKLVLEKNIKPGDSIKTPWMGMKISLGDVSLGGGFRKELKQIEPTKKESTPSSAIVLQVSNSDKYISLMGGESRTVDINGAKYQVYYGPKPLRLPFFVFLEDFRKQDYPGSTRVKSFESDIRINDEAKSHKIFMNEPFKQSGFTLYQSSYELSPGRPEVSIFSVNRDPGRWVKYIGSLILSIGIILYVFMKSKLYLNWRKK